MDLAAHLIPGKLWFGAAPFDQETLEDLFDNGINVFIDLTMDGETYPNKQPIFDYRSLVKNYYKFPFENQGFPTDVNQFHQFICWFDSIYRDPTSKIYIHCREGHGRSGLMAACLVMKQFNISAAMALNMVWSAHRARKTMKIRYRKIGVPQTKAQKDFVQQYQSFLTQLGRAD